MGLITFSSSSPYTLGVEIEFQLLEAQSLDLAPCAGSVMAAVPERFRNRLVEEFLQSILEIRTGICASVDEVAMDLQSTIEIVDTIAQAQGLRLYAASLHPFADPGRQVLSHGERYQRIMKELQYVGRQFICQGLHVHVGLDDRDTAIRVCDGIQVYLPLLLALSGSSPYFRGEDTGFASYRTKLFEVLPLAGLTSFHGTWKNLETEVAMLVDFDLIKEFRDLWWDVRPSPAFGTVEIRICDLPSRFQHILVLTTLVQALVAALAEEIIDVKQVSLQVLDCNKWQAARHGLEGRFTDPLALLETGTLPMRRAVALLVDRLAPWIERFGSASYLGQMDSLLDGGTSAEVQRRYVRDAGGFTGMIDRLGREFWV
ncbi:MAG: hypothetical protein CSA34_01265 [Desulfobulbus propionicus]|nr:MAG: hypothetical protein CSA34_01265 [Desulfobulbus propionicus]